MLSVYNISVSLNNLSSRTPTTATVVQGVLQVVNRGLAPASYILFFVFVLAYESRDGRHGSTCGCILRVSMPLYLCIARII
jgi:hypothetical protein